MLGTLEYPLYFCIFFLQIRPQCGTDHITSTHDILTCDSAGLAKAGVED